MLSLRIALRYLFSRKSHNAVNVISIISILGVAVATMAIVCVLSVFNGFSDLAMSRLSKIDPELKITSLQGKTIAGADSLAWAVGRLNGVDAAVAVIEEHALAMFEGFQMAVDVKGVPEGYSDVVDIKSLVIDGRWLTGLTAAPVASLSVGTAIKLGAHPEAFEMLKLYVPRRVGRINPANPMGSFMVDSMVIGAVYQVEDNDNDAQTVMAPLDAVRSLLEYSDEATAIEVGLTPGANAATVGREISAMLGEGYAVSNRLEQEAESFRMIAVEKWITFVMLAFILVIASFNVVSTLSMLIIEKKNNMATLRSIGAGDGMIRRIFLWEGWLISAVGGAVGLLTGVMLCLAQQWGGFIKLSADPRQLTVAEYPVRVEASDLLLVALLIMVVGWIVGYFTSRFAVKR